MNPRAKTTWIGKDFHEILLDKEAISFLDTTEGESLSVEDLYPAELKLPEHWLLCGVLATAINQYFGHFVEKPLGYLTEKKIRKEIRLWFLSDSWEPFSLNWILEMLAVPKCKFFHFLFAKACQNEP